jgi:hypothetical protein
MKHKNLLKDEHSSLQSESTLKQNLSCHYCYGGNMKLFLKYGLMLLWSIVLSVALSACVDTDSGTIPLVDERTSTKFVNLANVGTMSVAVDGGAVASVAYGSASEYLSVATGVRNYAFTYGSTRDTLTTALAHDSKYSVFSVYEPLNGDANRSYNFIFERRTYAGTQTYVPQAALVRFINLSHDTAATSISFKIIDTVAATADILQSAIGFGTGTAYYQIDIAQSPQFIVYNRYRDTLATRVALIEGRCSVVLFGNKMGNTMQVKVYKED